MQKKRERYGMEKKKKKKNLRTTEERVKCER
jgi:hypothetical protein